MADETSKAKPKRLSKGRRTHMRRLKQEARKAGTPLPPSRLARSVYQAKVAKKEIES